MNKILRFCFVLAALLATLGATTLRAQSPAPRAFIDGTGPGWRALAESDFTNVNCAPDTWGWTNGIIRCTGRPEGVLRMKKPLTNLEFIVEWRNLQSGGDSGVFLWATPESIRNIEAGKGRVPSGIEVQILDHGYTAQYEKQTGKKAAGFTTHGDIFPTGSTRMKPLPPASPDGSRSFPSKNLSKGVHEWNHYYIRAINGEVRLWVNGEEVSGAADCRPATGYLCLESGGTPIEFRNLRIRELP